MALTFSVSLIYDTYEYVRVNNINCDKYIYLEISLDIYDISKS